MVYCSTVFTVAPEFILVIHSRNSRNYSLMKYNLILHRRTKLIQLCKKSSALRNNYHSCPYSSRVRKKEVNETLSHKLLHLVFTIIRLYTLVFCLCCRQKAPTKNKKQAKSEAHRIGSEFHTAFKHQSRIQSQYSFLLYHIIFPQSINLYQVPFMLNDNV